MILFGLIPVILEVFVLFLAVGKYKVVSRMQERNNRNRQEELRIE